MKKITLTLPQDLADRLSEEAERDGKRPVTSLVRAALLHRFPAPTPKPTKRRAAK